MAPVVQLVDRRGGVEVTTLSGADVVVLDELARRLRMPRAHVISAALAMAAQASDEELSGTTRGG
jgi:hypothetical protein